MTNLKIFYFVFYLCVSILNLDPISVLLCGLSIYIVFLKNCGDFQTMILWRFSNYDFVTETQMVLNSILIKYMVQPQ